MSQSYDYIIVGAGLCGLAIAKDLSEQNKRVLILEKGPYLNRIGKVRDALLFYDNFALSGSRQGITIYRIFGVGGTTIGSCGNAVEFTSGEYDRIGIDIKKYLAQAKTESRVREKGLVIGPASKRIMDTANKMGIHMKPMPKFSITGACVTCGNCVVGCPHNMKWTAREYIKDFNKNNVKLITNFSVKEVLSSGGRAIGVQGFTKGLQKKKFFADKVILSAGGIGTPVILQKSGIEAGKNLFIDVFVVVYGVLPGFNQKKELSMSAVCDKFHQSDGFVLSPFVDNWASLAAGTKLKNLPNVLKVNSLMGIMVKIADDNIGKVHKNGRIDKELTQKDINRLKKGSDIAKSILAGCGVDSKTMFVTKPKGAHPGGTAAIGDVVTSRLETKLENLYVCDASVLPFAPGLPPMLSLIALAKWFSKEVALR